MPDETTKSAAGPTYYRDEQGQWREFSAEALLQHEREACACLAESFADLEQQAVETFGPAQTDRAERCLLLVNQARRIAGAIRARGGSRAGKP